MEPPADSPKMVTRSGSPPKFAMWFLTHLRDLMKKTVNYNLRKIILVTLLQFDPALHNCLEDSDLLCSEILISHPNVNRHEINQNFKWTPYRICLIYN